MADPVVDVPATDFREDLGHSFRGIHGNRDVLLMVKTAKTANFFGSPPLNQGLPVQPRDFRHNRFMANN